MTTITLLALGDHRFEVNVDAVSSTRHVVTAPAEYVARLTAGKLTAEQLVRRSFEFLLEREANTSILRQFSLPVIADYFPEYEREMQAALAD